MKKAIARQKPISYRLGDYCSKLTLQPAVFELISDKVGGDKIAYSYISNLAKFAKNDGVDRVSAYVQNLLLTQIISPKYMIGYNTDDTKKNVKIESPFHDKGTKIILDSALSHALQQLASETGTSRKRICDQYTKRYAAKFDKELISTERGKDLSFEIRESMIRDLSIL